MIDKLDEIKRLTKFWYEYVSQDHHKDHDCHWYVEQSWDYGRSPVWKAWHSGYIFEGRETICDSYDEALSVLLEMVREAIKEEQMWALRVLNGIDAWDEEQINRAKSVSKFKL